MRPILIFIFLIFSVSFGAPPEPGQKVYTIQVASFKEKREALKVLKRVSKFPDARISFRNGRYKVRVGFFKTYKDAQGFVEKSGLSKAVKNYYITLISFDPKDVFFVKGRGLKLPPLSSIVEEPTFEIKKGLRLKRDIVEDVKFSVKREEFVYKDKLPKGVSTSKGFRFNFYYLLAFIPIILVPLRKLRKKKGRKVYLESYIAELLDKGRYEELIDVAIPYISKSKSDTFVRKALAESYERLGRFLEAAEVYSEIAQILKEKGLNVLSEEFKRKAEELYSKEFKGGGTTPPL